MNVHTGSTPSGISYMQSPTYPNLMDINSTIKGTMQDLLKDIHKAEPKPIVNNSPLNNFENRNRNVSTLSQIANENKVNSFEDTFNDYDKGSIINSDDFDDDYKDLFLKPGNEFGDFFNTPFKNKEDELLLFTPQLRDSQRPSKKQFASYSEEKPFKKLSESEMEYLKPYSEQKKNHLSISVKITIHEMMKSKKN